MKTHVLYSRRLWTLAPLAGSFLFLLLYGLAAANYPGGSQADVHAKGFSWLHNYWCNLLDEKAVNGEMNAARPFGYLAEADLALTLLVFWVIALKGLVYSGKSRGIAFLSGLGSMLLLPLLPTAYHDAIINVSASLGLVAMAFIYIGLYNRSWYGLFVFGLFNIALVALNNMIYYGRSLYYLPAVQKITFASFLLWVCFVSVQLYRQPEAGA